MTSYSPLAARMLNLNYGILSLTSINIQCLDAADGIVHCAIYQHANIRKELQSQRCVQAIRIAQGIPHAGIDGMGCACGLRQRYYACDNLWPDAGAIVGARLRIDRWVGKRRHENVYGNQCAWFSHSHDRWIRVQGTTCSCCIGVPTPGVPCNRAKDVS